MGSYAVMSFYPFLYFHIWDRDMNLQPIIVISVSSPAFGAENVVLIQIKSLNSKCSLLWPCSISFHFSSSLVQIMIKAWDFLIVIRRWKSVPFYPHKNTRSGCQNGDGFSLTDKKKGDMPSVPLETKSMISSWRSLFKLCSLPGLCYFLN